MAEELKITADFDASQTALFAAWMSSKEHSAFTGGAAKIDARIGGAFTTWDGYIEGRTLVLEPPKRIVQTWRTTEFGDAPDSRLELTFEAIEGGSRMTLVHTGLPKGEAEKYGRGWKDFYLRPMRAYFGIPRPPRASATPAAPPADTDDEDGAQEQRGGVAKAGGRKNARPSKDAPRASSKPPARSSSTPPAKLSSKPPAKASSRPPAKLSSKPPARESSRPPPRHSSKPPRDTAKRASPGIARTETKKGSKAR